MSSPMARRASFVLYHHPGPPTGHGPFRESGRFLPSLICELQLSAIASHSVDAPSSRTSCSSISSRRFFHHLSAFFICLVPSSLPARDLSKARGRTAHMSATWQVVGPTSKGRGRRTGWKSMQQRRDVYGGWRGSCGGHIAVSTTHF